MPIHSALEPRPSSASAADRVRLLTFTTLFAIGGTERHVASLADGLDYSRFELEFGCLRRSGEFLAAIQARGLTVNEYAVTRLYGPHTVAQQLRFARYLRRRRIQIMHSYNFYPNVFAIPAARLARTPIVLASIRDTGAYLTPRQRRVQRLACRLADHILVNAEAVRQWLIAGGYDPSRISVIRNGLDLSRFTPADDDASLRRELGIPDGAPLVAMLSRLSRMKGVEDFLDAAAVLAERFRDTHFLVIGDTIDHDGPRYRRELEDRAARLGLGKRVVFTGFRLDVPRLLSAVAVSVLPSLSEGLSNTILESMAAGAPVVATRVGGSAEALVDGVDGLLVPPRDPAALSRAIGWMLEHPEAARELGRRARARVAEEFSLSRMIRETECLYTRLLEDAPRRRRLARSGGR
jgi:glycosyltransferase involved in cell wall biosynthesis